MNLIGKTQDETYRNVLAQVAERGWTIISNDCRDSSIPLTKEQLLNPVPCLIRRMTIKSGAQTLNLTIMPDGRVTREIVKEVA